MATPQGSFFTSARAASNMMVDSGRARIRAANKIGRIDGRPVRKDISGNIVGGGGAFYQPRGGADTARAGRVATAMQDGSFWGKRNAFNQSNPGRWMDEQGNITGGHATPTPAPAATPTPAATGQAPAAPAATPAPASPSIANQTSAALARGVLDASQGVKERGKGSVAWTNGARMMTDSAGNKQIISPYGTGGTAPVKPAPVVPAASGPDMAAAAKIQAAAQQMPAAQAAVTKTQDALKKAPFFASARG